MHSYNPTRSAETQNPRLGGDVWVRSLGIGELPACGWDRSGPQLPRTPSRQQEGPTSTGHLSPPSPTVPAWPSFLSCLALGTEGTEATDSHPQARPKESRPLTKPQHRAQASVGSQGPPPAPLSGPSSQLRQATCPPPPTPPKADHQAPVPLRLPCPLPRLAHRPMVPLAIHL